ncbi:mitochondrial carrier protein domain-containing protein [Phthorimaea operculella]|nr:mitochondrial carrier protein domain-containing protein [Phthorimaea operculella]
MFCNVLERRHFDLYYSYIPAMSSSEDIISLKKILSTFRPSLIHDPAPYIPAADKVTYGTLAGMVASAVGHPLDVVKTRIQVNLHPYTTYTMARRIVRLQGVRTLYRGLTASLYRQLFNTGTRLTTYNYLYDQFYKEHERRPKLCEKVRIGLVAGVLGAIVGNPSEVILVRMMATSAPRAYNKCPDLQDLINKRYYDFGDAFQRIISEEGVRALWRGVTLTVIRSMLNTSCQIGAYASFSVPRLLPSEARP